MIMNPGVGGSQSGYLTVNPGLGSRDPKKGSGVIILSDTHRIEPATSRNGQQRRKLNMVSHYPRLSEDDRYWAKMEDQWRLMAEEGKEYQIMNDDQIHSNDGGQIRITSSDIWGAPGTITVSQKYGGHSPKKLDHDMASIHSWVITLLLLLQAANLCIGILTWLILRGL